MKKFLLGTVALVALGAAPAVAADLAARPYTKAPMMAPAPIYNWTGFYLGGHIGGAFRGDNNALFGNNDGRFIGGVQVGYDYQFSPNWVLGLEAQYSFMANNNNNGAVFFGNRNLGSVTGRLGYTWGPAMLYAKGGYGWADTRQSFGFGQVGRDGYTVGAGLEYMFTPSWSGKVEYQYYDFGRTNFAGVINGVPVVANFRNDEHTIKVGLNYRFNLGGPVVARY
jgi:outer membrane immunogenic protein